MPGTSFDLTEAKQGGHFAALEEPEVFVSHLQECFDSIWPTGALLNVKPSGRKID